MKGKGVGGRKEREGKGLGESGSLSLSPIERELATNHTEGKGGKYS